MTDDTLDEQSAAQVDGDDDPAIDSTDTEGDDGTPNRSGVEPAQWQEPGE